MHINRITTIRQIPTFSRRLKPSEEEDYRQNALQKAFDYLGTEEVAMIIHGTSFPEEEGKDFGVGSPYGEEASTFIPFEMLHGFNSNQLGPVGVIRDAQHRSPYKATISTKNYLFLDFKELTKDEYANLLSKDDIDFAYNEIGNRGTNYAISSFQDAFANYDYLIKIANKNFKEKLANGDEQAKILNDEFVQFKIEKKSDIYKDALFDILSKMYGTLDFTKWDELDKNLIQRLEKREPQAISRYKKIVNRSKEDFESYLFAQFLVNKQMKENTQLRKKLGFKNINDLLVGFSQSDEWAHQDLFLNNYRMGCPYGGKYGPQLWNIPVLNPEKLFNSDGSLGSAGVYLKKKLEDSLENFDNLRIDHALGLIDPYIYDRNSIVLTDGKVDLSKFKAGNISCMPEIKSRDNYRLILSEIVLPTLKEYGIDKNSAVWEDLVCETPVFKDVYHYENHLPGITQLEYMRGENSNPNNWALIGSHDSAPAIQMVKNDWIRNGDAWNIFYLAGFLNQNPSRAAVRNGFCEKIAKNDMDRVKAKFAELFVSCKKVQISFADFFGIDKRYNVAGEENNDNWKLRLNSDYQDTYYKNLSSKNPTAINMPEILKMAVQAKADMNKIQDAHRRGVSENSITPKNTPEVQEILDNLDKYEKILKE
jgi:4-alpha-glucanotransferase